MNPSFSDPAFWSRFQFGFTLTYHYLFPQLTMGLGWFLVYWKWRALKTVPLFLVISAESHAVRPDAFERAIHSPFCWFGITVTLIAACTLISGISAHHEARTFLGSNFILIGLLTTGGAAILPVMLYSTLRAENSMTAYSAAATENSLRLALIWWRLGLVLAVVYFVFISRRYAGKVTARRDTQGYY